MGLCKTIEDREYDKFTVNGADETCVRVCGELSVDSVSNTAGKITVFTIDSSTWSALPATALTGRKAVAIQNQSAIEIKIQYDNGVGGYVGMSVPAGGERFYNITENIIIYAKAASGTPSLAVEELS